MRRLCVVVLAVACLVTAGCSRKKMEQHGVVSRITVQLQDRTMVYTAQDKMTQVLNGLRQLGQKTLAPIDPDTLSGAACQITLECTDGESTVYNTKGSRFLRKNQEPWKETDPKALSDLLLLFQSLTPDE